MGRFNNKVAFLTGGASGLAKTAAKDFASEGAKVVLFDFDKENGLSVEKDIKAAGGEALFIEGDVRNSESVEAGVSKAFEKFGTIDFLINGAGGNSPVATTKVEQVEQVSKSELEKTFYGLDIKGFENPLKECVI